MSEIAPDTTVTDSAPSSTASVAENVIDAFSQTETTDSVEVSGDTPTVDETPAVETRTPEPTELTDEEKLLQEFGFKQAKKPDGRDHYIPRPKVLQMIASGLKRGQERWTGEKTQLESQVQEVSGLLETMRTAAQGDPRAFLEDLAQHDPRYREFLTPQQATQIAQTAHTFTEQMPPPDLALADGTHTYSLEGIQKLLEWKEAKILSSVDARLKPITEKEQKAAQQRQLADAVRTRTQQQMQTAEQWPNWTDYKDDVFKRLQDDSATAKAERRRPTLTLREAYLEVKADRLNPEYTSVRSKVLAELKNAPKSPTAPAGGGETTRTPGPVTTQDVAARTMARLERGA